MKTTTISRILKLKQRPVSFRHIVFNLSLFFASVFSLTGRDRSQCLCPAVPFDSSAVDNYKIIFCGKVKADTLLNSSLRTVIFEVLELYKGTVTKTWEVHYNPDDPCALRFQTGDEWLLFLNYYQNNNSKINWCGHSRKYYRTKTDDPFWVSSGWEYDDVKSFLKKHLGTYRVMEDVGSPSKRRNLLPQRMEVFLYLIISATGMFLMYYITKKILK